MADRKLIGILIVAFRAERFIEGCIRQFDPVPRGNLLPVVVCSTRPWHGDWKQDDTPSLAHQALAGHAGATILEGDWATDAEQRNAGLDYLRSQGCEWALVVDTDEFYTPAGLQGLFHSLRGPHDRVRAPMMSVYWKTPEYRIIPEQHDNPIVAIKTDQRFTFSRLSPGLSMESHARLYHMSYVRSDQEMRAKLDSFEHHFEVIPHWYANKWLMWNPDEYRDLHPVVPSQFERAIYDPPPAQIMELVG